ncbi:hypothetical protein INT43_006832 [Umbelopsis isabellina]|uniref:Proteasome assembly chaperone 2 n=1 Tax=Mortierella isabellina TaxID=91625 RepID=A0A8H7PX53_MORIS|nr:hypothetical protein INT43_006832 [Umbelopsis isabellina]
MNTFVPAQGFDPELLKGSTLIIPTVSIANVPQLTIDLYVNSLKLERIGFMDDASVMPVAGIFEFAPEKGILVAYEVYQSEDRKFTFVQQRTPILKGKRQSLLANLESFISIYDFSRILIITSTDASRRVDIQMTGVPFRLLASPESSVGKRASEINLPAYEKLPEEEHQLPHHPESEAEKDIPYLHGSGVARKLYGRLVSKYDVSMLIMFALEGDNIQDSVEYAKCIDAVLGVVDTGRAADFKWEYPASWDWVFGAPLNPALYD